MNVAELRKSVIDVAKRCGETWKISLFETLKEKCLQLKDLGEQIPRIARHLNKHGSFSMYINCRDFFLKGGISDYYKCQKSEILELIDLHVSNGRFDIYDQLKNDFPDHCNEHLEDLIKNKTKPDCDYPIQNHFVLIIREGRLQEFKNNLQSNLSSLDEYYDEIIFSLEKSMLKHLGFYHLKELVDDYISTYYSDQLIYIFNQCLLKHPDKNEVKDFIIKTTLRFLEVEGKELLNVLDILDGVDLLINNFELDKEILLEIYKNLFLKSPDSLDYVGEETIQIIRSLMEEMARQGMVDEMVEYARGVAKDMASSIKNRSDIESTMSKDSAKTIKRKIL